MRNKCEWLTHQTVCIFNAFFSPSNFFCCTASIISHYLYVLHTVRFLGSKFWVLSIYNDPSIGCALAHNSQVHTYMNICSVWAAHLHNAWGVCFFLLTFSFAVLPVAQYNVHTLDAKTGFDASAFSLIKMILSNIDRLSRSTSRTKLNKCKECQVGVVSLWGFNEK